MNRSLRVGFAVELAGVGNINHEFHKILLSIG